MEAQRQSALHQCHLEASAHLQSFSGWQLPAWYTEPSTEFERVCASVGISDASHLNKLDLRGSAAGFALPHPARIWKLTPAHTLITSPSSIAFAPSDSVTDVTSVYSAILLAGPRSRDVLQKLTTLNVRDAAFADGTARQTRLAHVQTMLLRYDCAAPGFLLLTTRDVAEYVWHTLLHAGGAFEVLPFGTLAQQQWMEGADE